MRGGTDILGYIASGLVRLTFTTKEMRPLRIMAILSNLAFIAYGLLDEILPVLALHIVLLPLNVFRLRQLELAKARCRSSPPSPALLSELGHALVAVRDPEHHLPGLGVVHLPGNGARLLGTVQPVFDVKPPQHPYTPSANSSQNGHIDLHAQSRGQLHRRLRS